METFEDSAVDEQAQTFSLDDIATVEAPRVSTPTAQTFKLSDIGTIHPAPIAATGFTVPGSTRVTNPPSPPIVPGNIDLFAQPKVKNPDGSTSTVDSIGVSMDGKELLLPTVTPDGRHLKTADEAVAEYKKTGRHLGIFADQASSDAFAKQLHLDYAAGKYERPRRVSTVQAGAGDWRTLVPGQGQPVAPVVAPFNLPAQGVAQVAKGARALSGGAGNVSVTVPASASASELHYGPLSEEAIGGASDVLEGTFKLMSPVVAGNLVANPVPTGTALFRAWLGSKVGEKAAEEIGATPEGQRLAGNIGAFLGAATKPGDIAKKLASKSKFATRVAADAQAVAEQVRAFDAAQRAAQAPPSEPVSVGRGQSAGVRDKVSPESAAAPEQTLGTAAPPAAGGAVDVRQAPPDLPLQIPATTATVPDVFRAEDIATVEPPETHTFSSTQVNLPSVIADSMRAYGATIPKDDLAENGAEDTPHVTVKYGIHTADVDEVRQLLADEPPITVALGKTSFFPNSESDSGDVLKVDVDSPDLHRLNAKIASALEVTDTHPEYVPHATLAYLKPGKGQDYEGDPRFEGLTTTIDRITFTSKDGGTFDIPLTGQPAASSAAFPSGTGLRLGAAEIDNLASQLGQQPDRPPFYADKPNPFESPAIPAYSATLFQGRGATPEEIYGPRAVAAGEAVPIFGPAEYYADSKSNAQRYAGDNGTVTTAKVELSNPLVIDTNRQWGDLLRSADALELHSTDRFSKKNPTDIPSAAMRLQDYVRAQGYDGVVVENTDTEKRLRESFGHDTTIKFADLATLPAEAQNGSNEAGNLSRPALGSAAPPADAGAPAGALEARGPGERPAVAPGGVRARPSNTWSAPQRRGTPRRPATIGSTADTDVLNELIARARYGGFTGDDAVLRRELTDRLQLLRDLDTAFESSGRNPETLLRAIAKGGGIGEDKTFPGEIKWLRELRDQKPSSSRKNLKAPPVVADTVRGIRGVIRPKTGMTFGGTLEYLSQDPAFAHIESVSDLIDEIRAAATAEPDVDAARALRKGLGERWWENIQPVEAPSYDDALASSRDASATFAEMTDRYRRREIGDDEYLAARRTFEAAQDQYDQAYADEAARAPEQAVDVLDTGEEQPRLPDVGQVRDQNIATPEFDVPFSLESEVDRTARERPEDLFGGVEPGDEDDGTTLYSGVDPHLGEFIRHDVVPAGRRVADIAREARNAIAPQSATPEAQRAADVVARAKAAAANLATIERLKSKRFFGVGPTKGMVSYFDRRSDTQNIAAISEYERTGTFPGLPAEYSELYTASMDAARTLLRVAYGDDRVGYVKNYVRRAFLFGSKPDEIKGEAYLGSKLRSLSANRSPTKARVLDMPLDEALADMRARGITVRPATTNPETLRQWSLANARQAEAFRQAWTELREGGHVVFIPMGGRPPAGAVGISERGAQFFYPAERGLGQYYANDDVARVLNNATSRGLGGSPTFRGLRFVNASLNQMQLGLSAFHFTGSAISAGLTDLSLGIRRLLRGAPLEAGPPLLRSGLPFVSFARAVYRGRRFVEDLKRDSLAAWGVLEDVLNPGGVRLQMDQRYRTAMIERMMEAWRQKNLLGAALRVPLALIELVARPLMEYAIPRVKIAVALDRLAEIQYRMPNATQAELARAYRAAADQIDNKFGLMVYDNGFWNKTAQDLAQIATRSVGWTGGTLRWGVGAVADVATGVKRAGRGQMPELTDRMLDAFLLPIYVGVIGAVYMYLHTRKSPHTLKDLYYPLNGRTTLNGKPSRTSLPTYMKDVYAYTENPLGTAVNKQSPLFEETADLARNEDYFGVAIANPDDPFAKRVRDRGIYILKESLPFSLTQASRVKEEGGHSAAVEAFFGLTPAGANVSRSPLERYLHDIAPQQHLTQEQALRAAKRRDVRALAQGGHPAEAVKKAQELGFTTLSTKRMLREARTNIIENQFSRTSWAQAVKGYTLASEEERAILKPTLSRKIGPTLAQTPTAEDRAALMNQYQDLMRLPTASR